jgi:hypothetical protein
MSYEIIGTIYKMGAVESIATRSGNTLMRQSITLEQKRYDPNTGEPYDSNYPTFEFTNKSEELSQFQAGMRVKVKFDVVGVKYNDKVTGEEKFFSRLRGFAIELYGMQAVQAPGPMPQGQQVPLAPWPGQTQQYMTAEQMNQQGLQQLQQFAQQQAKQQDLPF